LPLFTAKKTGARRISSVGAGRVVEPGLGADACGPTTGDGLFFDAEQPHPARGKIGSRARREERHCPGPAAGRITVAGDDVRLLVYRTQSMPWAGEVQQKEVGEAPAFGQHRSRAGTGVILARRWTGPGGHPPSDRPGPYALACKQNWNTVSCEPQELGLQRLL